jgi:hypothetical protein
MADFHERLLAVIKEIAESILVFLCRLRNIPKLSIQQSKIIQNLNTDGISIVPKFLSASQCKKYISLIDKHIESEVIWQDDTKSDTRLFFLEEIEPKFKTFLSHSFITDILRYYLGIDRGSAMLLGARLEYVPGNLGSGGGWHRDSPFSRQLKAICYLNEVSEENGPFQMIPKTHNKGVVLRDLLSGRSKPGQYRFTGHDIGYDQEKKTTTIKTFIGNAGDLALVDTKCIHRGKPIEAGVRYVLFCYYWRGKMPSHFNDLHARARTYAEKPLDPDNF